MLATNKKNLTLFDEEMLNAIQPTGSPWIVNDDDPATVPVPLQVIITSVQGPYTERDRKLWTFLLHAVFDKLGKELLHEVSIRDINAVFRELKSEHSSKWIWESVKRLAKTTVEWEATYDDERCLGVDNLLGAIITKDARSTGKLKFNFPPLLVPILLEPTRFARLRVHFLIKLSGKYAVTLYELLEGYVNRRDGQCRMTIAELRRWLKVPENSYKDWKDFRKWVLDPAIKQINDDPLAAGFSVEYEAIRKGRKYNELVFKLTKTKARINNDRTIKNSVKRGVAVKAAKDAGRPFLSPQMITNAQEETRYFLDMEVIEREFWEHWESTGRPAFKKGVGATFTGFAKKKYGQMAYGKK